MASERSTPAVLGVMEGETEVPELASLKAGKEYVGARTLGTH